MCKESKISWKDKAIGRSKIIKVLTKDLKRQKESVSNLRVEVKSVKAELLSKDMIIKDLTLKKEDNKDFFIEKKVGTYKYSGGFMWLCASLYKCGLSSRQVVSAIALFGLFIGKNIKVPCHGTIHIWVHKLGLGLLKRGQESFRTSCEQWCLIIDESYSLGKSKLLVVLAVRLSSLHHGRICIKDVVPIVVKSQERWQSKDISLCITKACVKFKGQIAYVTSDCGSNLLCSYQEKNLQHVPDWAHYGANLLENIYEKEENFKEFNEKMGAFKRKRKQSIYTHYVPPTLSVKVRFMNYVPFLEWATVLLDNFKQIPKEIKGELLFLKAIEPFINEVRDLFYAVQDIGFIIKENGINPKSYAMASQKYNKLAQYYPNNSRITQFIKEIDAYFKRTLEVYFQYFDKQDKNTPFFDGIVASSEIIECLFGKLKHRLDKNPKRGFSANSLLIALFSNEISQKDTEDILKDIDCKTLEKWKNNNIANRKYTSFRNVFKKKRGK